MYRDFKEYRLEIDRELNWKIHFIHRSIYGSEEIGEPITGDKKKVDYFLWFLQWVLTQEIIRNLDACRELENLTIISDMVKTMIETMTKETV